MTKNNKTSNENTVDKKQVRKEQAELRKKAAPLRKQADKLEKQMHQWQDELNQVEVSLSTSEIYQSEYKTKLTQLIKQQAQLTGKIEENEMHWLELEEQVEEIMSQAT